NRSAAARADLGLVLSGPRAVSWTRPDDHLGSNRIKIRPRNRLERDRRWKSDCALRSINANNWRHRMTRAVLMLFLIAGTCAACAAEKALPAVSEGKDHKLSYATDERGDRVPDFSYAGYRCGDVPIPHVPVRVVVS